MRLIDDSYNANPDSVRAAIRVLAAEAAPRALVLGDMGEVGSQGPEFHAEVGAYAAEHGIEALFCHGLAATGIRRAWEAQGGAAAGGHFGQIETLCDALSHWLAQQPGTPTVLVKGSRSMRMERVVQYLSGQQGTQGEH